MKIQLSHKFEDIIGLENLLEAWQEFVKGKRNKKDVQEFSLRLIDNIISLHQDLANRTYRHGGYQAFKIYDQKPRDIHKASVRDRLLHHALYRKLYPFFNRAFIADSFSCQIGKGTHKAINRFRAFSYKISKNNTKTCWALKCDIKKFFASIDHAILLKILQQYIPDQNILWLLKNVIGSFFSMKADIGLPLGNLTSQLLVNTYMNEFDQFVKHKLKIKHYIRYCDDFVILGENKEYLEKLIPKINYFLNEKLKLALHLDKISIRKHHQGIDFLGYISFPHHRILRTKTKRRMFHKIEQKIKELKQGEISEESFYQTIQSYLGILKHCNSYKLQQKLKNQISTSTKT